MAAGSVFDYSVRPFPKSTAQTIISSRNSLFYRWRGRCSFCIGKICILLVIILRRFIEVLEKFGKLKDTWSETGGFHIENVSILFRYRTQKSEKLSNYPMFQSTLRFAIWKLCNIQYYFILHPNFAWSGLYNVSNEIMVPHSNSAEFIITIHGHLWHLCGRAANRRVLIVIAYWYDQLSIVTLMRIIIAAVIIRCDTRADIKYLCAAFSFYSRDKWMNRIELTLWLQRPAATSSPRCHNCPGRNAEYFISEMHAE